MNPEDLETIRKATEQATPGPWTIDKKAIEAFIDSHGKMVDADAHFIANARTWIPQLLVYIEELETELEAQGQIKALPLISRATIRNKKVKRQV